MSHVWCEFVRSLERDRYEIDSWVDRFRRGETITGVVMTSVAVKPPVDVVLWRYRDTVFVGYCKVLCGTVAILWYCDSTVPRNNQYRDCHDFDDIN